MKNIFKKAITTLLLTAILMPLFNFSSSAAGSAIISFSKQTVTVGETVTVTVTFDAKEPMSAISSSLSYNADILNYQPSDPWVGGAGMLTVAEGLKDVTKVSYTCKFTALTAGSVQISVSNVLYGNYASNTDVEMAGASANLQINNPTKSANANLKSLKYNGKSVPNFSANTTTYNVTVPYTTTTCDITCTTADADAKIAMTGGRDIPVGKTTRTLTITAPNGTQKQYAVIITRLTEAESVVSEPEDTTEKTLDVTINGAVFTIISNISEVKLPTGFKIETITYNQTEISVAKDNNYTIYYLKSAESDTLLPYTLSKSNTFNPLDYFTVNDHIYIINDMDNSSLLPKDYFSTSLKLGDKTIKCIASNLPTFTNFYIIYCYYDGVYGFYRYDSNQETIQRDPEFSLLSPEDTNSVGFIANIKSLDIKAKTVLIFIFLFIIAIIALIVLIIVKKVNQSKINNYEYSQFDSNCIDFDVVSVQDTLKGENLQNNSPVSSRAENDKF